MGDDLEPDFRGKRPQLCVSYELQEQYLRCHNRNLL
jgi:hypothetical protein